MRLDQLQQRWKNLFLKYGEAALVQDAFDDLAKRYAEKHRYYHTLRHVNTCLMLLDEVGGLVSDLFSLETAIWFHDVIYDPLRNDNEAMSAVYVKRFLKSVKISDHEIAKIERLILLTKHPSDPLSEDEKYLIDIDLSILGAETALYDQYEKWIRQEYAYVSDEVFRKGRGEVLRSFFAQDFIYQTDYFRQKLENRARENIDRALYKLSICE